MPNISEPPSKPIPFFSIRSGTNINLVVSLPLFLAFSLSLFLPLPFRRSFSLSLSLSFSRARARAYAVTQKRLATVTSPFGTARLFVTFSFYFSSAGGRTCSLVEIISKCKWPFPRRALWAK